MRGFLAFNRTSLESKLSDEKDREKRLIQLLIEPVWNRNKYQILYVGTELDKAFNRTSLESKLFYAYHSIAKYLLAFNRTSLESKRLLY